MLEIPILTYHKISNKKEIGLTTVSTIQFDAQMAYLKRNGYESVCFTDLKPDYKLPQKPVIITFDDGYENIYHNAIPILNKYRFKAVVFTITDYIGRFNKWEAAAFQQKFKHLSGNQLIDLKNNGHEIASHGKAHKYLPFLEQNAFIEEINGSKASLEELIEDNIISFCYPYGRYTKKIKNAVKDAGYLYATANPRIRNRNSHDPFSLNRRSIYGTDSIDGFISKTVSPIPFNLSFISESVIQKGALASIGINLLKRSKSNF